MANKKKDVFVSYSNLDKNVTDKIVDALKFFGAKVWYQLDNSKLDFILEINQGINDSNSFAVIISHNSLNSVMVKNEINRAIKKYTIDKSYKIVPIIIEQLNEEDSDVCELLLGSFNWLILKEYKDYKTLALTLLSMVDYEFDSASNNSNYSKGIKDIENVRIQKQAAMFSKYISPIFDQILCDNKEACILDFGCGTANNIMYSLKNRQFKYLLGVDIEQKQVDKANKNYGDLKNVKFIQSDIFTDEKISDFLKEHNLEGFDLINISSVLLHIKNYEEILAKLKSFLKKDGYIVVLDEDDGLNIAQPFSQFFDDAFTLYRHSLYAGDRYFARKLPSCLKRIGYVDIQLKNTLMTSIDFDGKYKESLWDLYFNPYLWSTEDASAFDDINAFKLLPSYIKRHDQMKAQYMNDEIFIALGVLIFVAKNG